MAEYAILMAIFPVGNLDVVERLSNKLTYVFCDSFQDQAEP